MHCKCFFTRLCISQMMIIAKSSVLRALAKDIALWTNRTKRKREPPNEWSRLCLEFGRIVKRGGVEGKKRGAIEEGEEDTSGNAQQPPTPNKSP